MLLIEQHKQCCMCCSLTVQQHYATMSESATTTKPCRITFICTADVNVDSSHPSPLTARGELMARCLSSSMIDICHLPVIGEVDDHQPPVAFCSPDPSSIRMVEILAGRFTKRVKQVDWLDEVDVDDVDSIRQSTTSAIEQLSTLVQMYENRAVLLITHPLRIKYIFDALRIAQHFLPMPCSTSTITMWRADRELRFSVHTLGDMCGVVGGGFRCHELHVYKASVMYTLPDVFT